MTIDGDCRRHADECLARAKDPSNKPYRDLWLQLAKAWGGLSDADALLAASANAASPTHH